MGLAIGTKLGQYEVISLLGAGGMGEVYKARDARLGREVAIKVIPEEFFEDKDRKERFEREARTLASLNHPGIAAIHSFEEIPGSSPSAARHVLVMELLDGESLRERLEKGALPPRKAIELAVQIANGLSAAHEKGIVHRDLKPENVFLTKEGRVKILDFGLAKLTQPGPATNLTSAPTTPPATTAGVVLGTVGYMSPEQVRGEKVDARSDIFNLGAILYEMLSGNRAFKGASAVETMHAILKDDPPEISANKPDVSPSLERIVRRCLEKSADERFHSARDIAFALEAVSGTSRTGPMQPLDAPRVSVRRARLFAAVLAIAVAAVGGYVVATRTHKTSIPTTRKVTFRRGEVGMARFTPDGQSVVYAAAWDGKPMEVFSARLDGAESRSLGLPPGDVLAISSTGKMAISLGRDSALGRGSFLGTLAEVPLGGSAPREILGDVAQADYSADGSKLAVMHREKGKFRLEYPAGTLLYESSYYILFPRISPSGDLIAFFEREPRGLLGGWSLAVIDLSGKKRVLSRGWVGGADGAGLAWFPGTGELWFNAGNTLYSVRPGKREEPRWQSTQPLFLQDISRDGKFLITIFSDRTGISCLPPGETQERDLSLFGSSDLIGLSADGSKLLFDESEGGASGSGTYFRKTDGSSPAVRLGERGAVDLSPDGKRALLLLPASSSEIQLIPTGAGSKKVVKFPGITCVTASMLPDGERIIVSGHEEGHGNRLYVQNVDGGQARPFTPEGIKTLLGPVSPDGKYVIGKTADDELVLFPVDGGTPRPIPGLGKGGGGIVLGSGSEVPSGWSADGQALYIHEHGPQELALFRLDLRTGRKELWKKFRLPPATEAEPVVAADGRTYAYTYTIRVSDLYLLEGLR